MFIVSAMVCATSLIITLGIASKGRYGPPLVAQPLIFLLGCFLGGLPSLLVPLLFGVLCIVSISCAVTYRRFSQWAFGLTVVALVVGSIPAVQTISERIAQRDEYPFEDLSQRLPVRTATALPLEIPDATLTRLNAVEQQLDNDSWEREARARSIERLHQDAVTQFVNGPGFGISRMPIFSTPRTQSDPGPIDLPQPPYVPDEDVFIGSSEVSLPAPSTEAVLAMHQTGIADFVNQSGFGFQNRQGEVAGFESHRFRNMPDLSSHVDHENRWLLIRLELVSLLEHDEPCVYESPSLPRMDEATVAGTRSLNGFEADALEQLQRGEDVVTRDEGSRFLSIGSLRAASQCVDCHSARRGELLGAFSYEFRPLRQRPDAGGPEA